MNRYTVEVPAADADMGYREVEVKADSFGLETPGARELFFVLGGDTVAGFRDWIAVYCTETGVESASLTVPLNPPSTEAFSDALSAAVKRARERRNKGA